MTSNVTKTIGALLLMWLLVPGLVYAQTGTIVGTVTDEDGDPLGGATVFLPSLNMGTSVDLDGRYVVSNVPEGEHRIRFSFVGFRDHTTTVQVASGQEVTLNVTMEEDVLGLDQIVVTGYGVQRKRDITGSISSVDAREIQVQDVLSPEQALQGRTSGVLVTTRSGEPGGAVDMRIRGTGSINAGNQPLYVIDGVPVNADGSFVASAVSGVNPLSGIRMQDIESIEVLKDAAAASIYGAQAANGVVLITTRRGSAGNTQISAEARVGQVTETTRFDMLHTDDWAMLMSEAYGNYYAEFGLPYEAGVQAFRDNLLLPEQREMFDRGESLPFYDWQDAAMRTGIMHDYQVTARGGTENTQFYVSGSYDYREGQYIRSFFDRFAFRSNLDHQATDRLRFEANINVSTQTQYGYITEGNYINGVLFGAPLVAPNLPIRDEETGEFIHDLWLFGNPIQAVSVDDRFLTNNRVLTNVAPMYEIADNLFFRTNIGVDYNMYRERGYRPPVGYYADSDGGSERTREVINLNINPTLNYSTVMDGVHNISGILGGEYRREYRDHHGVFARGYPSEFFRRISTAAEVYDGFGYSTEYRIAGGFVRGEYNYDNRYYVTANMRYDGSSRFGADRRWGFFYSGSFGWDIAQEPFLADVTWLDQFQPRVSYGTTGNSQIGNYSARALYGTSGPYMGVADLRPSQLANPLLTWEEAATLNLGVDIQLFGGRVYGSVEAYRTDNRNLLLDRELPIDSGFSEIDENVGKVRNEGIEVEISTVNIDYSGFRWMTDFNITFQRNEVLELVDGAETFGSGSGSGQSPGTIMVGQPIHVYYVPRYAGVNPADGRAMWLDADGNITYTPNSVADAHVVGSPYSDYYGGLMNRFSYAGITLEAHLQFDMGADTFKQQQTYFYETPQWTGNMTANMLRRWQEPGDITDIPRMFITGQEPGSAEARALSSRHVKDRSYMRLKQLRLSYELPQNMTTVLGLRGMTLFAQGTNLITWTAYDGLDPEIYFTANGYYPPAQTLTTGLRLDF